MQLRAPAQPAAPEPAKPPEPSTQSSDKRRPPAAVVRRRRLAAILALALAGIVALIISWLVGSGPAPPATGAAAVVPADALAYVNLSIDPSRGAVGQAGSLAARFPGYRPLLSDIETRVGEILSGGAPLDFARDVAPWLGNEAALAVLNTTTSPAGSLIVLDVSDRARARAFLARSGARPAGSYRRVQLFGYPTGTELAFLGRYLAFGQDASLRAAIDVQTGIAPSLQRDPTYQRAAAGEPAGRVLDAYASASGVQRLLMPQHGVIGAVGALLDQPALGAAALSLSPADGGARLKVHTVLDPQLAQLHLSTVTTFTPSIPEVIPAGSTVMLDTSSLDSLAPRLLRAGAAGGVIGQVGPLLKRLGVALAAEGVNVGRILALFHGETAVAVSPAASAVGAPDVTIITRTGNPLAANEELGALEAPLAQLFAPGSGPGQSPLFNDRQVGGITAHQLSLGAGLQVDYAVFRGLVVVSTSLSGISAVLARARSLGSESAFRTVVDSHQKRVGSLLFLDFSQLLSLGEQMGLTHSARLSALGPDLERISAVGLSSTSGKTDTTAELFLQIP